MPLSLLIPVVAYLVHAVAICAFAVLGSFLHEVTIFVPGSVYAVTLLAALVRVCRLSRQAPAPLGARVAAVHATVSTLLFVAAEAAEHVIPVAGGVVSFVSSMLFFVLNYPGLPVAKLLPYPGNPPGLWGAVFYVVLVSFTAAWLLVAVSIARAVSRRVEGPPRNAA